MEIQGLDEFTKTLENAQDNYKKEAKKLLTNFEITYVGDGDIVKEQSPVADTRYYETGTIRLYMGS